VAAVLAIVLVGVVAWRSSAHRGDARASRDEQAATESARPRASSVTAPMAEAAGASSGVSLEVTSGTPASSARDRAPAPRTSKAHAVSSSARPPPARTDDCDPPFVVDSAGIKIPKRSCLEPR
jgi:hypothetical protein